MKKLLVAALALIGMSVGVFLAPVPSASAEECVKGESRFDFVVQWSNPKGPSKSGVVKTATGKPLCKDVQLNVSSYLLPENYNGKGWWDAANNRVNQTMVPQSLHKTVTYTMKKGTDGSTSFNAETHSFCGRWWQVDPYWGDQEIKQIVGKGGLEDRIISGSVGYNGECKPEPKPEPKPVECPEGTVKDSKGACINIVKKDEPKKCPDGTNPNAEGKCPVPAPEPEPEVKECPEGTTMNEAGNCVSILTPAEAAPLSPQQPQVLPETGALTYVGTGALVTAAAVGAFMYSKRTAQIKPKASSNRGRSTRSAAKKR